MTLLTALILPLAIAIAGDDGATAWIAIGISIVVLLLGLWNEYRKNRPAIEPRQLVVLMDGKIKSLAIEVLYKRGERPAFLTGAIIYFTSDREIEQRYMSFKKYIRLAPEDYMQAVEVESIYYLNAKSIVGVAMVDVNGKVYYSKGVPFDIKHQVISQETPF